MITQNKLKQIFSYNKDTGELIRIWSHHKRFIGKRAGCITPKGYRLVSIGTKTYWEHRLIWLYVTGEFPKTIDHKNGVKDDNKWENLRNASNIQNGYNRGKTSLNTSGYKGVYFHKPKNKWRAIIKVNTKRLYLGSFNCPTAAHFAYCQSAKKNHKQFARTE